MELEPRMVPRFEVRWSHGRTKIAPLSPATVSPAMIIFQANSLFGQLPYPLSRFRFERYMTPYASMKGIQVLHYATASINIGAVEGG